MIDPSASTDMVELVKAADAVWARAEFTPATVEAVREARAKRAAARAGRPTTPTHRVVLLPPRAELAEPIRAKVQAGEQITKEEQRLLMLALPRKTRLRLKIRTTAHKQLIGALRAMGVGADTRTQYTGNTNQHQQRYEVAQRLKAWLAGDRPAKDYAAIEERRRVREAREDADAARRARFDAARSGK